MKAPNFRDTVAAPMPYQQGTALVMCLVILLVLTIIGIAAMGTSTFEEKMARNVQDSTQAFEIAESGIAASSKDPSVFVLTATQNKNYTIGTNTAQVTVTPKGLTPPRRSMGYSASDYDAANFDQQSKGTAGDSNATLHRGVAQIVPK